MKISCCLITTSIKNRFSLLNNAIKSIEKNNNFFDEKILSVDVFNNDDLFEFNRYSKEWRILYKKKDLNKSMILNQQNVLKNAKNDIIFYLEDDIVINSLPKLNTIDNLFNGKLINNRPIGFISYNNHVWFDFNKNPKHIIDYINDINNYTTINDDVFLIKNMVIKDKYYLNFPVSIFRGGILLELHKYAITHCKGLSIEAGLTKAWFDLKYDNEFEVLIYLKSEILDDIKLGKKITVLDFYNYANMNFWNNDKNLRHPSVIGRSNNVNF